MNACLLPELHEVKVSIVSTLYSQSKQLHFTRFSYLRLIL